MLTWEDYNQDDTAASAPEPAVVAAAAATQSVIEEPAAPAAEVAEAEPDLDAMHAAEAAIANIDTAAALEELEISASRVSVDEKAMINCRADLNQLSVFNMLRQID